MQAVLGDKKVLFAVFAVLAVLYIIRSIIKKIKKTRRMLIGGSLLMSSAAGSTGAENTHSLLQGINIQTVLFVICAIFFALAVIDIIRRR